MKILNATLIAALIAPVVLAARATTKGAVYGVLD
jgi:Flp pilus assembly pilin Flp